MRPRPYARIEESVFDLYLECDRLPWYYQALATASTWLALIAYSLYALVFTSPEDNLQANRYVLTTVASVALVLAYVAATFTAVFSQSLLFAFDHILTPMLTASVTGVFITVINFSLHKRFEPLTEAYIYIPLVTSCITTIIAAFISVWIYIKLKKVKKLDERRRVHVPIDRHGRNSHTQSSPVSNQDILDVVPDDEAQRRQLLRLLLTRDPRHPSFEDTSSTYRISLPSDDASGTRQRSGSMPETRSQTGTSTSGRWNFAHLLPGRGRSLLSQRFLDPRERRREEIERSSMLLQDTPSPHAGYQWSGNRETVPAWHTTNVRYA